MIAAPKPLADEAPEEDDLAPDHHAELLDREHPERMVPWETALPEGSLDGEQLVFPLDDLSHLPPAVQAAIEEGEADVRAGRVVSHERVQRSLEQRRRARA